MSDADGSPSWQAGLRCGHGAERPTACSWRRRFKDAPQRSLVNFLPCRVVILDDDQALRVIKPQWDWEEGF